MSSGKDPVAVRETPTGYSWTPAWLDSVRRRPNRRRALVVAAGLLGLGLAWLHWLGLILAGILVGLFTRTVPRAVFAGIGVGALVLVLHVLASPVMSGPEFLALTPLSYVSIAVALVAPIWGSLVRAVV